MYGDELVQAFREFKAIWDPQGRMNPGKVVDPYRIDENLRLGMNYRPAELKTHFQFPEEGGSFARATTRCVGVGKCRRMEGGTMCPSYMVTREEAHSTRGRSRLLFEMLQGNPVKNGWRDEHVKEALDLCLACKGCKGDCPVNVDMATYKAEFLSNYYSRRLRPASAYAFGLIYWWAGVASHFPGLINFLTHAPGLNRIAKTLAGIAPARTLPSFARETFKSWFKRRHASTKTEQPTVILWPDTFNNHLHPRTAAAAVEVLEAAGFQVEVPTQNLCCGRPLYDYGMLDLAKALLRQVLDALRPSIEAGVPIVVLEPSCAAVFRDELINLFPHDEDARRLSRQTFLLSEILEQRAPTYEPPSLRRKAVVHGHCHHKAVMKMTAEERLLQKVGLDYQLLDSGCCGMAGGFGFEKDHYDVSVKAGERVLLPAVRQADAKTLIVADGFSCRTQIEQLTDRHALHLAEVMQMALREGPQGPEGSIPERSYVELEGAAPDRSAWIGAAATLGFAAMIGWRLRKGARRWS
jgi:Fe-S oxidoreductase